MSTRPPTADMDDDFSLSEGAFHMALGELGLSILQVDMFGSVAMRKCPRVWTKEDNRWKRGWSSNLWDLLYVRARQGSWERVVAKIGRDRARAVVINPSWESWDAKDAPWVEDVRCMTLIDTQLFSTEDIFVDARGNPLPPPANVCFVEKPLDLVSVTKIWARQLLVADELWADLGLVKSELHDFAIGNSEGDRRGAAAQGSGTQKPFAQQAHLSPGVHKDLEDPLLAGTAHHSHAEMQVARFADLAHHKQLEDR